MMTMAGRDTGEVLDVDLPAATPARIGNKRDLPRLPKRVLEFLYRRHRSFEAA